MKTVLSACLLLSGLLALPAAEAPRFGDAFVFTFIDRQIEQDLGGPPFDRSLYAKAVDRCRELGAKGVLIKLFLDQERPGEGDAALAQAMRRIPVILQARIEPQTGLPAELDERFSFQPGNLLTAINGDRGWLPIPKLAASAADIGFVDFADENVPLLETYRGKTYRSIVVSVLELQSGAKAKLGANTRLLLGDRTFPADGSFVQKVVRLPAPLPLCSFADLLAGKIDPSQIKGRVVVLGYTGKSAPIIPTPAGGVEAHVFFGQCLRAVFESLHAPAH